MRMLICTIGSRYRKNTLRFSKEVAKALSAETTLLGIVDKKREAEKIEKSLKKVADELASLELPVQVRVDVGSAESLALNELEQSTHDLVAIGALAGKRSRRAPFGSVAMRIIERAENSVLLIKGRRPNLSRVLIAASGTEHGHLSVWAGAALACGADAQTTVLHVVANMPAMYAGLEQMEETLAELLESDTGLAREIKWAAQVVKAECPISEIKLRRGIVADEILREGQHGDYDVIVLGSSRYSGGIVRALMGDLTREVVNRAERPVLVVRPMD